MATPSHLQREQALASLDPAIRLTKIQTLVTIRDVIRRIILPSARSRRSDGYVVQVGVDHALKTYTFVRPHMDLKGYCDSAKGEFDLVKLLSSANVVAFNQRMDIRLQESVYYTGPGKAWLIRELSHEEYVESDMYKETVARMTADPTQYVSICAPLMNVIDKKAFADCASWELVELEHPEHNVVDPLGSFAYLEFATCDVGFVGTSLMSMLLHLSTKQDTGLAGLSLYDLHGIHLAGGEWVQPYQHAMYEGSVKDWEYEWVNGEGKELERLGELEEYGKYGQYGECDAEEEEYYKEEEEGYGEAEEYGEYSGDGDDSMDYESV